MGNKVEIKIDTVKVDAAISKLTGLKDRANSCSNMTFLMSGSDGAAKDALIDSFYEMTNVAQAAELLIGRIITKLEYAKTTLVETDQTTASSIAGK